MADIQNKVGQRIKTLRERKKWSQERLATEIGISRLSVGNYERGDRTPDFDTISKLASCFGYSTDYIMGFSDSDVEDRLLIDILNKLKSELAPLFYKANKIAEEHEPWGEPYAMIYNYTNNIVDCMINDIKRCLEQNDSYWKVVNGKEDFDSKRCALYLSNFFSETNKSEK